METWELLNGEVSAADEGNAVRFRVDCAPPCELTRLLRCYGTLDGAEDFLVGVLEPQNGRLRLDRRVSKETLRQAGAEILPVQYYLSDGRARGRAARTEAAGNHTPDSTTAVAKTAELSDTAQPQAQASPAASRAQVEGTHLSASQTQSEATAPTQPPAKGRAVPPRSGFARRKTGKPASPSLQNAAMPPHCPRRSTKPSPAVSMPSRLTSIPQTGDPLLDAALACGEAHWELTEQGLRITCPFSPMLPFPLAFAAVLCRVDRGTAVLDWQVAGSRLPL